ncbi:hypothetical protein DMENIID0001_042020 [Sergentomyia squamirostris]
MAEETEILPGGLNENKSEDASGEEVSNGQTDSSQEIEILPESATRGVERSFAEISDQMNPMSPLKAVQLSGEHESLMSDDETPRVLTTLEPVKKQEGERKFSTKEVTPTSSSEDPGAIARKQLETLNSLKRKGRPKADDPKPIERIMAHINEKKQKIKILENRVLPSVQDIYSGLKDNKNRKNLHSNILTKEEISREIIQKCRKPSIQHTEKLPHRSKLHQDSTGTIEIPEELILSADDPQPILVHETESLEGQDLLAILEGDDDDPDTSVYEIQTESATKSGSDVHVEEYTIALITDPSKQKELDKDKEIEIAMKQIMSLPVKPKGRRPKKASIIPGPLKQDDSPVKSTTASDLVSSLVSDWSDNEDKTEEMNDDNILVIKKDAPVAATISQVQKISPPPLKSSRIIKKKVIWDPDAPETQVSYASKVHQPSSSKGPPEKMVVKRGNTPKVLVVEEKSSVLPSKTIIQSPAKEVRQQKRAGSAGPSGVSGAKKKRVTEVDRLLGDEGAVNMLYELERENNNAEVPEIVTKPDKNLMISKSKEKNALVARAKAVRNIVIKATDTPQRGRPKREVTPFQISPPAAPSPQTKRTPPTKKRSAKDSNASSSASESWDFLYSSAQGDDSMIIRRRSNSSYSGSTTSPRRLSIDQHQDETSRRSSSSFEFAKPVDKKTPKVDPSTTQNLVDELKGKISQAINRGQVTIAKASDSAKTVKNEGQIEKSVAISKVTKEPKESSVKLRASERKLGSVEFKEITIRRYDNFVQLIFSPTFGILKNVLTIGLLSEVKTALNLLKDDSMCKLVLVTSAGSNFCQGIDFSTLIQTTADKRKSSAHQLLSALKDFIESLATFPKPLVAGVHGSVGDLGVTVLPLFDVVLSSEAATFYTNYAKIGQLPEANAVLNLSKRVSSKGVSTKNLCLFS